MTAAEQVRRLRAVARTLIKPDWCYSIHAGYAKPGWNGHQCWATVTTTKDGQWDTPGAKIIEGYGKTEELSVCIAALRAKQAEEMNDD